MVGLRDVSKRHEPSIFTRAGVPIVSSGFAHGSIDGDIHLISQSAFGSRCFTIDCRGQTLLHLAADGGTLELVRLFLALGLDVKPEVW